jgi:carboxyl-terminal processing protease
VNTNHTGRTILIIIVSLILLAGTFAGGLIVGWLIPSATTNEIVSTSETPTEQFAASPTATNANNPTDLEKLFKPFWETWNIVHEQFVDQPVDDLKLMQGAIRGMLDSLGDQHTGYMTPEEYDQATMPLDGSYTGIGAWVDTSGEFLTIISPMAGSPAEAAGIKSGDEIIAVDGVDVTKTDPSVVLQSVLGPEGTTVVLTVRRHNPEETLDFSIVRARITIPSIESKMLDGDIAYIYLATFGENSSQDMIDALTTLLAENPKGLILDLRDNSGGYVDTAIEIISQFIPEGAVMIEKLGTGEEIPFNAIPGGIATEIPLVVLVNGGSASASEIAAGAIQDYNRGLIVGTKTYGKGSVQNWIPLNNDQGAVKVTIARWLTPKGRLIHEVGLTPDHVVELTDADIEAGVDPQLQKAIELLLGGE